MSHSLSNPYEISVNGIVCKASPYGIGQYIAVDDIDALGGRAREFKDALYREYEVEETFDRKTKALQSLIVNKRQEILNDGVEQRKEECSQEGGVCISVEEIVSENRPEPCGEFKDVSNEGLVGKHEGKDIYKGKQKTKINV